MGIDSKFGKLASQLIRETVENTIKWQMKAAPSQLTEGTDAHVDLFFHTAYKGKSVGIFREKFRHFYDEFEYTWSQRHVLCILDRQNNVIWEWDEAPSILMQLFNTARESASEINQILSDLVGEDDDWD